MRTTVTLDSDVEQLVRDAMQRTRQSFKVTINQAIRRGLTGVPGPVDEPPFEVEARPMGVLAGVDPAGFNQLADELEVEAFLRTTQALQEDRDSGK